MGNHKRSISSYNPNKVLNIPMRCSLEYEISQYKLNLPIRQIKVLRNVKELPI